MSTQLNRTNCYFCSQPILKTDRFNIHHIKPRSEGGPDHEGNLTPTHEKCHRLHHRTPKKADGLSDFQRWGKLSALDKHWSFYLRGVKDNPAYEPARNFYRLYYAKN